MHRIKLLTTDFSRTASFEYIPNQPIVDAQRYQQRVYFSIINSAEIMDDPEFAERWARATEKLCKASKKDFSQMKQPISIQDVLGMMGENKSRQEESSSKHARAKDVLSKTLECLQTLGQFAIQGVSMVRYLLATTLFCIW